MTAPKVKMLAHNGGLPSGNYPATDLVRYIRADAPELVALVDAAKGVMRHMPDYADTTWQYLEDAIAAYEAMGI